MFICVSECTYNVCARECINVCVCARARAYVCVPVCVWGRESVDVYKLAFHPLLLLASPPPPGACPPTPYPPPPPPPVVLTSPFLSNPTTDGTVLHSAATVLPSSFPGKRKRKKKKEKKGGEKKVPGFTCCFSFLPVSCVGHSTQNNNKETLYCARNARVILQRTPQVLLWAACVCVCVCVCV